MNLANLRCSRIDLAVDDYSKMLQLDDIEQACKEGNHSGFKISKSTANYGTKHGGWTVNLGDRTSEKYVRIYDKNAESKGAIDAHRFEVEYSGELSNKLFYLILEFPSDEVKMQKEIANYALGAVSFVDKNSKNLDRNELLTWWYEFLEFVKCDPIRLRVKRFKTNLIVKKQWIRRAVSKALSLLKDGLGEREFELFVNESIEIGKKKYTNFDELILWEYQKVSVNC